MSHGVALAGFAHEQGASGVGIQRLRVCGKAGNQRDRHPVEIGGQADTADHRHKSVLFVERERGEAGAADQRLRQPASFGVRFPDDVLFLLFQSQSPATGLRVRKCLSGFPCARGIL
jgi:hypothetical protein